MTTTTAPICASCREPVHTVWRVTEPVVYVICGASDCDLWARAQGLRYYGQGYVTTRKAGPAPTAQTQRVKPCCAGCGGELPRRSRDRFHAGGRPFCTLTCVEATGAAH